MEFLPVQGCSSRVRLASTAAEASSYAVYLDIMALRRPKGWWGARYIKLCTRSQHRFAVMQVFVVQRCQMCLEWVFNTHHTVSAEDCAGWEPVRDLKGEGVRHLCRRMLVVRELTDYIFPDWKHHLNDLFFALFHCRDGLVMSFILFISFGVIPISGSFLLLALYKSDFLCAVQANWDIFHRKAWLS